MIVIGLTGSIGMGKSTVAEMMRDAGLPVFDADAVVHELYASGGAAVEPVRRRFPGAVRGGAVDRDALARAVLGKPQALAELEAIVHPLVRLRRIGFLDRLRKQGERAAVLEIPLLFETGGDEAVDLVVVVSAPPDVQRARVLARPGMTDEKLAAIRARQTPENEKRAGADLVIDTGGSLDETRAQVDRFIASLDSRPQDGQDNGHA